MPNSKSDFSKISASKVMSKVYHCLTWGDSPSDPPTILSGEDLLSSTSFTSVSRVPSWLFGFSPPFESVWTKQIETKPTTEAETKVITGNGSVPWATIGESMMPICATKFIIPKEVEEKRVGKSEVCDVYKTWNPVDTPNYTNCQIKMKVQLSWC